ncbi:Major facilitator superfamily domain general substrate transporter [Penicillium cf. griseofulvum]|uniref:Major facilitator superfamily domain general substrate transporter n=1 Tax=Penicillium cf. griseofulvum TaxID=2972120 RepID=A0A9W9J453_9EURO|nr:Major facilitator superfamily domain general substrate transporter [Penicillium cf. griseofulvum]
MDAKHSPSSVVPTGTAGKDKHRTNSLLAEERSIQNGDQDILQGEKVDEALAAKMRLINDTIDEIGFTAHHWKLFCLNGFGYAVDSLILLIQSIISAQARLEFKPSYSTGLTIAVYVGMLVGAIFWGVFGGHYRSAVRLQLLPVYFVDIHYRRGGCSLLGHLGFVCLPECIWCWRKPGSGYHGLSRISSQQGTVAVDTHGGVVGWAYTPSLGQLIAGLFAWAFLPNFSCSDAATCTRDNNQGWRYVWYTSGALVFILSALRVTIIRLEETPKFLISEGKDEQAVGVLRKIADRHNRPCSLTIEKLQACGQIAHRGAPGSGWFVQLVSLNEVFYHLRGLFATSKMALSTSLVWLSWLLIGLAYPLYNVFLPTYLASRGATFGQSSPYITWRNYAINNTCGIFGPVLAGFMCRSPWFWGRRGTMIIGAVVTMVFFFCYTQVRTADQNLGFTCAISFCLNVYYGTLYAYTPEIFPSAHRGTGNGVAIGLNRIMGIVSAVVGQAANTSTPVPIYICAALYIVMAIVAGALPFEPYGRRSS